MGEWFRKFFDNTEFMPHGRCWAWEPWVVWSNVISDAVITLSYLTIGATLWWFVRRRRDLAFNWMFLMFATFIVACGLTHAMEILNTWNAYFRLAGGVKIITAIASLPTAVFLIQIMPKALDLPTPEGLAQINEKLRSNQDELERTVAERTRELKESQETLRLIYQSTQDPLMLLKVAPGGALKVVSCNNAWVTMMGRTGESLAGRPVEELIPPPVEPVLEALQRALRDGKECRLERRAMLPDGERVFDSLIVPIQDGPGGLAHVLIASRDITDRSRIEEALRQSQKLESLGVLAGGIAHDFNNLLTSVLGNANLGSLVLPVESPGRIYLAQIEEASLRAADLTRQLLAYAGKGNFVVAEVDLNRAVAEMTKLLSVSISKKAALRYDFSEVGPKLMADPSQVQQLIMNLVTNASEAIGEETSGLITIRTGLQFLEEAYIETLAPAFPLTPGLYATLEVSDSGCGMSQETQARIFDPFYTTKFTGRGLGLSAMMGILRSHKGSLKLYSELGKGSTFKLFLPALAPSMDAPVRTQPEESWRGQGQVLVVDDEAAARAVARQMTESLGFKVLEATDGREAVEVFRSRHQDLALVFMDLTMPHMDGREAFAEMRRIDPKVPVILCSGYSETDAAQAFVGRGLAGFLQKPYRHSDLVSILRKALETL